MSPSGQVVRSEANKFVWPVQGVTRAPYQLFTDPEIYKLEQVTDLSGKDLEFPVPGGRDQEPGD